MVIYSNEIKDFLDKIYLYELTHRNDLEFPLYSYYEGKLHDIDKLSRHTPSSTFPLSRDRLFGLVIGRLEFGYLFDGTDFSIEYYINREPQNDWFDWLVENTKSRKGKIITQKKINDIISEVLNRYLGKELLKA